MTMYAHTPGKSGEWHDLLIHLQEVARKASIFAEPWGGQNISRAIGLAHDLGKADPRFQDYLKQAHQGIRVTGCPHSAPGAAATESSLGGLGLTILGHHGGMPNLVKLKQKVNEADQLSCQHAAQLWKEIDPKVDLKVALPEWARSGLSLEFFIRMSFSTLVDTDWLDIVELMQNRDRERSNTEKHFHTCRLTWKFKSPRTFGYRLGTERGDAGPKGIQPSHYAEEVAKCTRDYANSVEFRCTMDGG